MYMIMKNPKVQTDLVKMHLFSFLVATLALDLKASQASPPYHQHMRAIPMQRRLMELSCSKRSSSRIETDDIASITVVAFLCPHGSYLCTAIYSALALAV
jgi:hypothetical protein